MKMKSLVLLTAFVFAAAALAPADAKTKKRVHHTAQTAAVISGTAPAHMIEVRPGLWISSYGCVTDEGNGRFMPCDMNDGKN